MSNSGAAIRHKLYDYIRVADDKKLNAIYNLMENELEQTSEWWKDRAFTAELDRRFDVLEKGISINELQSSVDKLRKKKYG